MTARHPRGPTRATGRRETVSADDVAAQLNAIGVPPDQARAYVQLVRRGATGAGELAQALRISRPRAYRALEALGQQGFVTAGVGRPRLFTPASPVAVLRALRERSQAALAGVERVQASLVARLEALRDRAERPPAGPHFTVVRGLDALASAAHDVYHCAGERIDLLLGHHGTSHVLGALGHGNLLGQKAEAGVDVRVLLPPQAPWPGPAHAVRRCADAQPQASVVVADGAESLVVVDAGGPPDDGTLGFRTNAAPFVALQQLLFDGLWDGARPGPAAARRRP